MCLGKLHFHAVVEPAGREPPEIEDLPLGTICLLPGTSLPFITAHLPADAFADLRSPERWVVNRPVERPLGHTRLGLLVQSEPAFGSRFHEQKPDEQGEAKAPDGVAQRRTTDHCPVVP